MRYKATFLTGLATGYVLGSKAGRGRYEQIARAASSIWQRPMVQSAAGTLGSRAAALVDTAKSSVSSRVGGRDVSSEWVEPAPIRL
ncbi:MAG: hypothetical protein ABIM89_11385 [Mycobacteriales bacterium]